MATTGNSASLHDATRTDPRDWSYISEGGATIVFSYNGPPHPHFSGTVLRLRKIEIKPPPKEIFKPLDYAEGVDDTSSEDDGGEESSDDDDEPDDPSIAFQNRITSRIISPKHLPRLEAVKVGRSWLEHLKKHGEKRRPESRRTIDTIDTGKKKAVLATDLVGGAGWAVEIKPKWAFLPNPVHLSSETREVKTAHCRFCMHTHQRAVKSPDKFVTKYCPLDLFSGDQTRVRKAIADLWDGWVGSHGTINNLKIFISGSSIAPTDVKGVNGMRKELGVRSQDTIAAEDLAQLLPAFTESLLPVLMNTSILTNLALLQRTLDPLDIEGLAKLWSRDEEETQTPPTPVGIGSQEVTLKEWDKFVGDYLAQTTSASWSDLTLRWNKPSLEDLRYYMLSYLLSATFKDCSVIIRLPGRSSTDAPTITAIDLDPKSVARLSKWEELDKGIVDSYIKSGDTSAPPCIDAALGVGSTTSVFESLGKEHEEVTKGAPLALVCMAFLTGACITYFLAW